MPDAGVVLEVRRVDASPLTRASALAKVDVPSELSAALSEQW